MVPRRAPARRPRSTRRTVLVVTNGRTTEKSYLEHLKQRVSRDVALTVRFINGSPSTLLKELRQARSGISDVDEVWIVVDHDGQDRRRFLEQCQGLVGRRAGAVVHGVVSVPCFEVWLNAHYGPVRAYQDQADAQRHYRELTGQTSRQAKALPQDFPWDAVDAACTNCHLPHDEQPALDAQGPCPSTTMPHLARSLGLVT